MTKTLRSDELGEIGESHFKLITAQAKLICNKSTQDMAGWDYIVDWSHSSGHTVFDSRQNPISVVVQVKGIFTKTNSVRIRLSSAERLLKDPKPSFIYVVKIDSLGKPCSARLIHMYDDVAEQVLKKLRETQMAGVAANKVHLVLKPSKLGPDIALTGDAFVREVERVIGGDVAAYVARKSDYLKSVGYEDGQFSFTATFGGSEPRDIADLFLGLKSTPMTISNFAEVRFGLPMRIPDLPDGGKGIIIPQPVGQCELAFRRSLLDAPLIITGEMYGLPPAVTELAGQTIMVRAQALTLRMDEEKIDGDHLKLVANITINLTDSLDVAQTASEWAKLFRLLHRMTLGPQRVQINSTVLKASMEGEIGILPHFANSEKLVASGDFAERIFDIAGASNDPITLKALQTAHDAMTTLKIAETTPNAMKVTFDVEWHAIPDDVAFELLTFHVIPFGTFGLAYCCKAKVSQTKDAPSTRLSGNIEQLVAIRRVNWQMAELDRFQEDMTALTGIESRVYNGLTHDR